MPVIKLRKAILNPWLFVCCGVVLFILLRAAWMYIVEPDVWITDSLSFLINPMAFSGLSPFAAFFCVIPYSTTFCDEYRCGFVKTLLPRTTRARYALSNIVAVSISGALAIAIPFFITCLVAVVQAQPTTILPDFYTYTIWEPIFLRHGTAAVMGGKILLGGLFGMVWAQLGLFVSCLSLNRFVTVIVPFVIYQSTWSIFTFSLGNSAIYLRGDSPLFPSLSFVVCVQLCVLAVLAALSFAGIVRRCRDV